MSLATEKLLARRFQCGPVSIDLAGEAVWQERLAGELLMFDVPFEGPGIALRIEVRTEMPPAPAVQGGYLQCNRFKVDREGEAYVMAAQTGAWCRFDTSCGCARAYAPDASEDAIEDVEQFLIFALVWGWRATGWVHMHAATLVRAERCALICAESHGGKSTFTAACVRRGLQTLGDDKVLIRPGAPALAYGLSRSMNLDPEVAQWFPEVGVISALAPYSRWTPKRKVRIESLWPGATRRQAMPTVLLKLRRVSQGAPIAIAPLTAQEVLQALARQTVIPSDRQAAAMMLRAIMQLSAQMRGWIVSVSPETYGDPEHLGFLDELLA
jgi:hypothetical protein